MTKPDNKPLFTLDGSVPIEDELLKLDIFCRFDGDVEIMEMINAGYLHDPNFPEEDRNRITDTLNWTESLRPPTSESDKLSLEEFMRGIEEHHRKQGRQGV